MSLKWHFERGGFFSFVTELGFSHWGEWLFFHPQTVRVRMKTPHDLYCLLFLKLLDQIQSRANSLLKVFFRVLPVDRWHTEKWICFYCDWRERIPIISHPRHSQENEISGKEERVVAVWLTNWLTDTYIQKDKGIHCWTDRDMYSQRQSLVTQFETDNGVIFMKILAQMK